MKLKKVCAIVFKLVQLINVLDLFVEKVSNILMLYNNKRKYEKFGQSRITGVVSYSFIAFLRGVVRIPIDIKNRELVRIVNV